MNKKILISAIAISASLLFSCKTETKETKKDSDTVVTELVKEEPTPVTDTYSGNYVASAETACAISVNISKTGDSYSYTLTSDGKEYKGTATLANQEAETYITFEGKIETNEPKAVSGLFQGTSIMIQNYGNAMNEFHLFKNCDAKYIELVKEAAK